MRDEERPNAEGDPAPRDIRSDNRPEFTATMLNLSTASDSQVCFHLLFRALSFRVGAGVEFLNSQLTDRLFNQDKRHQFQGQSA